MTPLVCALLVCLWPARFGESGKVRVILCMRVEGNGVAEAAAPVPAAGPGPAGPPQPQVGRPGRPQPQQIAASSALLRLRNVPVTPTQRTLSY